MVEPHTDRLIEFLNAVLAVDRDAVASLMRVRATCNEALLAHPTVQVSGEDGTVGVLGLFNGFCGTIGVGPRAGWGPISAVFEDGKLVRFERTRETQ